MKPEVPMKGQKEVDPSAGILTAHKPTAGAGLWEKSCVCRELLSFRKTGQLEAF